MTSTKTGSEVLKQDSCGRVRVPLERREALLDEFEKSGASGAQFARIAGLKYATFANWVHQRRKRRIQGGGQLSVAGNGGAIPLFEALVESGSRGAERSGGMGGLLVEMPGGSRMRIESPVQMAMAAELVALIAQRARARC